MHDRYGAEDFVAFNLASSASDLVSLREIYRVRAIGLADPYPNQYGIYRVPHPEAPYPQDTIVDKQGRIRYWEKEFDLKKCLEIMDEAAAHTPPVTAAIVPDTTSVSPGQPLGYSVTLVNHTAEAQSFDASIVAVLSDSIRVVMRGPIPVDLGAGGTITVPLTDTIPTGWPLGSTSFKVVVGPTVEDPWYVDGFGFQIE